MKKGKAARGIISGFVAKSPEEDEALRNRESELLKSLRGMIRLCLRACVCVCVEWEVMVDEEVIPCVWPKSVKVVGGSVVESKRGKKNVAAKGKGKK